MLRNKSILKGSLLLIVILTAREYARWTYDNLANAQAIVSGLTDRPFIYRALVPWLAQLLVLLGMHADAALTVLVVLSAIGLIYGIKFLLAATRSGSV
jgi:hypothetical protein